MLAIIALIGFASDLFLCSGCVSTVSTVPYVNERPTQRFQITRENMSIVWFSDGAPTVLSLYNPTPQLLQFHVVCNPTNVPGYIDTGHIEWYTCVDSGTPNNPGEKRRFVEFMNIDALNQVCDLPEFWPTTRENCIEQE